MTSSQVTYAVDFSAGSRGGRQNQTASPDATVTQRRIPRIARLMALAIRFDEMVREERIRDYAELARLGRVTRARMTQIMKLRHLAPDIQEQILFLPDIRGLNERNLRSIVSQIDWDAQRRMFQKIAGCLPLQPQTGKMRHRANQRFSIETGQLGAESEGEAPRGRPERII